jgi:lipid-A-disaccharide synthase
VASSAEQGAAARHLALVAGEVSGDMLAARLMAGLRRSCPTRAFPASAARACSSRAGVRCADGHADGARPASVIPRYRELKGIQNRLRDRLLAERPAAFIGADYPGFNLGLEEQLRAAGIPTVHFVGPQIWAWRGGRIKKIQRAVSHMLVIFPFEEEIYRQAGVPVTYIGHPLAEQIPMQPDVAARAAPARHSGGRQVVTVMPGSRMSELKYLTEPFAARSSCWRSATARCASSRRWRASARRRISWSWWRRPACRTCEMQLVDGQSHTASPRPTRCWRPPARRRWKWRCSRSRW